jgi:hydrogenase/urease accessory protein HupE
VILRLVLLLLAGLAGLAPSAAAHEIRPAFLQIREIEPQVYDFLWKTPARGDMRLALNVIQPESCANASEPRATLVDGAVIQRWRAKCAGGLVGQAVAVENLSRTLTDAIVRFEPLDGAPTTFRVTPDAPAIVIPAMQPWPEVAGTFFVLGVEHILLGVDHLLFVFALLLLISDVRRLLGAITAFTVAHSLTLAGTTFGWISLPSAPVEATIALSIMFLAVEIVRVSRGATSLTSQAPWLAAFAFGLLHGFGFAGALREIGIPEDSVATALLFFNLGVEAGQLAFIGVVLLGVLVWRRVALPTPEWVRLAPSYAIGAIAAFWFLERTAAILT